MARAKRSGSNSMRDSDQTGPKKTKLHSKGSVPSSRMGRHESISDMLGSEFEVSDDGQDDLDDARNALKNLQTAIEKAERSDTFAKDMEKKVRMDEKRLRDVFEREEKEWHNEDKKFQSQFSSRVRTVMSSRESKAKLTSYGPGEAAQVATSDIMQSTADHPLYLKTQGLLESARALMNELDNINTQASKIKLPPDPMDGLEKDTAEARRLIARGAEATVLVLEKQLVYPGKNDRKGSQLRDREEEAFLDDSSLQTMLDMGRDALNSGRSDGMKAKSWGFVAHHLQRGMQELVKALPSTD
ncbi:hypothetical protein MGYG_07448 [Nannizzia gypsea CBS 118893]|uniref:Uncharacterized protein n=1 Tax=Arthroderma gypseum (strain ATCC MYA-4604 / CBS 118893) TaxID=535722 RepID=E4V366_ARTGP|nr:hypothetical protein MGYG_07448 [Nannizzia gypsea CBS 118893]EFR04440.1 hypothetical protein MGYG_07448 [Nannizzia gypsea CBS 118893]